MTMPIVGDRDSFIAIPKRIEMPELNRIF